MNPARPATDAPFWAACVTLARVRDGAIVFCNGKGDKKAMLADAMTDVAAGDVFFLAWTGQWKTDIFAVTSDDLARWRSEQTGRPVP